MCKYLVQFKYLAKGGRFCTVVCATLSVGRVAINSGDPVVRGVMNERKGLGKTEVELADEGSCVEWRVHCTM